MASEKRLEMTLTYTSYISAVFVWAWATRQPFWPTTLAFLFHVPFWYGVFGTQSVPPFEFFVYYPAMFVAAALLGFVFTFRINNAELVTWFYEPEASDYRSQWASNVKWIAMILLLHTPSVPLELIHTSWIAGLVSIVVALIAYLVVWLVNRRDTRVSQDAVARRTFFFWIAVFDVVLLRLPYTVTYMVWPAVRTTFWPLYIAIISVGAALLVGILVLEYVFLRPNPPVQYDQRREVKPLVPVHAKDGSIQYRAAGHPGYVYDGLAM